MYIMSAPVASFTSFTHDMQMFSAGSWRRSRRPLCCCYGLLGAGLPSDAAAAASEDVPVPGGTAALAQALGIDPVPDRGRFVYEISRLLYNAPEGRRPSAEAYLLAARQALGRGRQNLDTRPGDLVPVPLTADLWSTRSFIARSRRASWSPRSSPIAPRRCCASASRRSTMRRWDSSRITRSCSSGSTSDRRRPSAPSPPACGSRATASFRPAVSSGTTSPRVEGDVAALWEGVVLEKVTRADRFIQQLLELNDGRLAYLYDVIGQLDPARRAFALGLWMPNAAARAERFKALTLGVGAYRESHLRTLPLGRASYDLTMTLSRVEAGADGTPVAPAARGFWSRVFGGSDLPDDPARQLRDIDEEPIDAAWLVEAIGPVDVRVRAERLDQIAFGQRLFGAADAAARADVLVAVRALSRYRMLMWTLERIGIRAPAVYAQAARQAARLGALDGRRGFEAQAQFQGALAILARAAMVTTLDAAKTQALDRAARRAAADRGRPLRRRGRALAARPSWPARSRAPRRPSWRCSRRCRGRRPATARSRGR